MKTTNYYDREIKFLRNRIKELKNLYDNENRIVLKIIYHEEMMEKYCDLVIHLKVKTKHFKWTGGAKTKAGNYINLKIHRAELYGDGHYYKQTDPVQLKTCHDTALEEYNSVIRDLECLIDHKSGVV